MYIYIDICTHDVYGAHVLEETRDDHVDSDFESVVPDDEAEYVA